MAFAYHWSVNVLGGIPGFRDGYIPSMLPDASYDIRDDQTLSLVDGVRGSSLFRNRITRGCDEIYSKENFLRFEWVNALV